MNFTQYLFYPTSLIYSLIIKVRNILFDKGILKTGKVPAKVISVGNISLGGSGKTPTVIYLTKLLKSNGFKPGVLSRGYRRKSSGFVFVSNEDTILESVDRAGDEIYLVADECNVPTAVCERRVEGATKLLQQIPVDTIILDDAYQHRWIHRDINILIFDQRLLTNAKAHQQNMLPIGIMREPFSESKRADIIIINKKFSDHETLPEKITKHFKGKALFYAGYQANSFVDVKKHTVYPTTEFIGQKSLVICGIAKPHSFLSFLQSHNIDINNKIIFYDHKDYELKEIELIRKKFYETNSYSVITTQKDAVKLKLFSKELDDIDIYYLHIDLVPEEKENFDNLILEKLRQ